MADFGTRISSNAKAMALRNIRRMRTLDHELKQATYDSQTRMLITAAQWSSGPFKAKWLRRQARKRKPPRGLYSRVAPAPPADPALTNEQKGRFKDGWRSRRFVTETAIGVDIYNVAHQAKWMHGTEKMIPRPILRKIFEVERPKFMQRIARAGWFSLKQP